jgi:hypothetical protein
MSINANATLIKSYDFNGDLSDTLGNGLDLTASGGTVSGGRYSFSHNQGLKLTSALPSTTDYAIELGFQINDSLSGWNKIIDFQDLASDHGFYEFLGAWRFLNISSVSLGSVSLNTDVTVGLARSADTVELFINGTSLGTAADGAGQAVSGSNVLNFFEDDFATGQRESFRGSVDFIRIHDDSSTFGTAPAPVPEPATLLLLSSGLIGLAGFGRKKFKKNVS